MTLDIAHNHEPIFDSEQLEADVTDLVTRMPRPPRRGQHQTAAFQLPETGRTIDPVHTPSALPDWVKHVEGVPRVGELSATAIAVDWEATAKQIETMGKDLMGLVEKCENQTKTILDAIKYINETATYYREQAKQVFEQIENASILTENVRKACVEMREKIETTRASLE
jgi:hypothetical protein